MATECPSREMSVRNKHTDMQITFFLTLCLRLPRSYCVSKLYLFSSNRPSSIALISVGWTIAHLLDTIHGKLKNVRSARCFEWYLHNAKLPAMDSAPVSIIAENWLPVMYHARGIPRSRHAPQISPSASSPHICFNRCPASGPRILRRGSRASP